MKSWRTTLTGLIGLFLAGQGLATGTGIPWTNGLAVECQITGLSQCDAVAVDAAHGKLYVTDRNSHRVLRFGYPLTNSTTVASAEAVFGQANLTGASANRGGSAGANTLNLPYGLAVGPSGELWVSDCSNNRLLMFANAWSASGDVAAAAVLGQTSFTATTGGTSASLLQNPTGLIMDASTNLWVADMGNHRVLGFFNAAAKANGASANRVLGQANFTSSSANQGSGSASSSSLSGPYGVGMGGTNLWVAEYNNSRVLRFNGAASKSDGSAADGVLGQTGFTSSSANRGGAMAANTLAFAAGVAVDANGRVYVSDKANRRVLIFLSETSKTNGAAADYYLGAASFTSSGSRTPWNLVYDDVNHRLLVANADDSHLDQYFNCYTTTNTLAGSPNPCSTVGATVTLTSTVTTDAGGPVASGYVSFWDGATCLGSAALNASGQATLSLSTLSDSTHAIVAVLTNTTTHKGSSSAPLYQVIGKYTASLAVSNASALPAAGDPVVFTATVTPRSGDPSLSGSVAFAVDGIVQATVSLNADVAAWTNSSLTAGTHSMAARYSGDANFRPLTNSWSLTVNPAGMRFLSPVANVEHDTNSDDGTFTNYDGNAYGGMVYCGYFPPAGFAAFKFDLSGLSG